MTLQSFRRLRSPRHAAIDLALLAAKSPQHPSLPRYGRNPARHADDILHELLKVATEQEVREARENGMNGMNGVNGENGENGHGVNGLNGSNGQASPSSPLSPLDPSSPLSPLSPSDPSSPPSPPSPPSPSSPPPLQKEQEYPGIHWDDLADPAVQTATILYNDRVNTYRKMQAVEDRIDRHATQEDIIALAELRIRSIDAFTELQAINDGTPPPCRHPLLAHLSLERQLEELLQRDPETFLKKHRNTLDNIRRYKARLKDPRRKERRKQDRELLKKHQETERIFQRLLKKMG